MVVPCSATAAAPRAPSWFATASIASSWLIWAGSSSSAGSAGGGSSADSAGGGSSADSAGGASAGVGAFVGEEF